MLCDEKDGKRPVFTPIPKDNAWEYSNYHTIAFISHASKVTLKILQARLQNYVSQELLGLEKAGEPEIKLPTLGGSEKTREFQKNIYFCFIDYVKAFDCVVRTNWKILKERRIPDHLTCLLRNLYRSRSNSENWTWNIGSKLGKEYIRAIPCLFNFYAEYIMWNARLDEAEAGIKTAGRNINHLRNTDDTTLMAESNELQSLLIRVREWESWLRTQHSKN